MGNKTIQFTIPGRIGGKGRPRFVRATGRTYTPEKTRNTEAMVRQMGAFAMRGIEPLPGAVSLTVRIFLLVPKSWSSKRRAAAVHVTGKPDIDNSLKLIADALNGICWRDDSQISAVTVQRTYTQNGPERVEVSFQELLTLQELSAVAA